MILFLQKYKQIFPDGMPRCHGWRHREWVEMYRDTRQAASCKLLKPSNGNARVYYTVQSTLVVLNYP